MKTTIVSSAYTRLLQELINQSYSAQEAEAEIRELQEKEERR